MHDNAAENSRAPRPPARPHSDVQAVRPAEPSQGATRAGAVAGLAINRAKIQQAHELRRTMSAAERLLWHELRGNRLGGLHFRRQQVIEGFIADFYCHAAALVAEVDGPLHAERRDYDANRDAAFAAASVLVLRFTTEEVRTNIRTVLTRIADACSQRMAIVAPSSRPRHDA